MSTHKTYQAQIKADGTAGTFEALVSVFGNVDLQGDRVIPGAFTKSLETWRSSGDPIPVLFNHDWSDPFNHIGAVQDAKETEKGLLVKGRLDLTNPNAAQIHKLMKQRLLKEFSFSYDIEDEARAKDGANELRQIHLIEVGPTLKGANPATQLLTVKADTADELNGAKAGRTLSQANHTRLLAARDLLDELLAAAEVASSSEPETDAKVEEPAEAKTDEHEDVKALREAIMAAEAAGGSKDE